MRKSATLMQKITLTEAVKYVCNDLKLKTEVAIRFPYERTYKVVYDGSEGEIEEENEEENKESENKSLIKVVFITFKTGKISRDDTVLGVACTDGDVTVRLLSIRETINTVAHELKHIEQYTSYPVRSKEEFREMHDDLTLNHDINENEALEYGYILETYMRGDLEELIDTVEEEEHIERRSKHEEKGRYNMNYEERFVKLSTGNRVHLPSEASIYEMLDSIFEEYEYGYMREPISKRGLELSKMHVLYVVRKWLEEEEEKQKQRENEDED